MSSSLLSTSPLASRLLELAAQKASGRLGAGDRTFVLVSGDLAEISPAPDDDSLEQFLTKSGRLTAEALAQYEQSTQAERLTLPDLLVAHGVLGKSELRQVRRALLLDRLARALRGADERPQGQLEFTQDAAPRSAAAVPLVPLLLDALARFTPNRDAAVVGTHLNHRIEWLAGAHLATAQAWADLGEVPQRPAVSTVLAKRPAAAPRLSALLRAGFIRLDPPGRAVPSEPPEPGKLPAPPRDAAIDARRLQSDATPPRDPLAAVKPPKLRLDPGFAQTGAEPLDPTPLPSLTVQRVSLEDPLIAIEQHIAELEAASASGAERARALCALADGWRDRFGSIERACRCFREAATADPSLPGVLQQAASYCHQLGQRELAQRYIAAAVAAASIPIERAAAQRLRATIARSGDDAETCIEALCEAAADDPTSSAAHEQVSALLLSRGQLEGANAHARLAATCVQEDAPERALCLLAHAFTLEPHDAPTAYEYASLLDAAGRRAAAVAVLAHTGSRSEDPDQRRKLRLAAAERAEAAGRADLASELLVEAFDAEPHFDLLYGPLDDDLSAIAFVEYRAVVLEDVATACPDEQRAHWLTRAAEAQLAAEGQHEAAVWLLFEAVLLQPRDPARLAALRTHAQSRRELTLLAHALRATIAARLEAPATSEAQTEAKQLLAELAELARAGLDNPHLAFAALRQLQRISDQEPELERTVAALSRAIETRRAELERSEQALARAAPEARPRLCLRVAGLLPDLPEHWSRAIQLLSEALAGGEEVDATRDALETLYGVSRDATQLAAFLEDQAELCHDREERVRLLARLAAVHTVREDMFAVAAVCESLVAIEPTCRVAIARLERAARKLGDVRRLTRALELRCEGARSSRQRGRALAQLARARELAGMYTEAAKHAVDALREDPSAADAALLFMRHIHRVEPEAARFGLRVVSSAFGPSRALLACQVEVAQALEDGEAERVALDAWVALLPNDAAVHRARLRFFAARNDAESMLEAAELALCAIPSPDVVKAAREALEKLEQLGAFGEAARLALRVAAELGTGEPEIALRALTAAQRSGAAELISRALELRIATSEPKERGALLLDLAGHYAGCGDAAAEIRALTRALEFDADRPDLLQRLRALLTAAADGARLVGVIDLELERVRDPARRKELRLLAAAVQSTLLHDRERAEYQVRALVAEHATDSAGVRDALGALFTIGSTSWALARCQAIAESCPPELGSRIYQWCTATAEQRAHDAPLALEIACRGALRWPAYAELLLVVERLTLGAEDIDTAMEVYGALVAASVGPHGRRALLYRAGRWLERAGHAEQALERYVQAFDLGPSTGAAFKAIDRLARQTGQLRRVLPCYAALAGQTRDGNTRAALLCAAADVCLRDLGDLPQGFALLMQANAATEHFDHDDRLLDLACEFRAADPDAGFEACRALAAELAQRAAQLWSGEEKVRCLSRLARVQSEQLGDHLAARARLDEALSVAEEDELPAAMRDAISALRSEIDLRAAQHAPAAGPQPGVQAIIAAAEAQPEPAMPLLSLAPPDPGSALAPAETPADARARLHRLLAKGPWCTGALRELHALSALHGSAAERHVLSLLLSRFDAGLQPPSDLAFHPGLWRGTALRDAIGEDLSPELMRFLSNLWDYARVIPRLRRSLATYGVAERDRISRITVGPVAEAYAQAARVLGATEVPVYVSLQDSSPARTLPTHPPAVVAGRGVAQDPCGLLYAMAHALWLAHPERIVFGVLAPEEAAELLEAARLAFAPALAQKGAGTHAKELAAALWQSVPTREQRQVSEVLTRAHQELAGAALRERIRATAARAALLSSGGLGFALRMLPTIEPELREHAIMTEAQFEAACRLSPAFAETVRCALSAPFQAALAQLL